MVDRAVPPAADLPGLWPPVYCHSERERLHFFKLFLEMFPFVTSSKPGNYFLNLSAASTNKQTYSDGQIAPLLWKRIIVCGCKSSQAALFTLSAICWAWSTCACSASLRRLTLLVYTIGI